MRLRRGVIQFGLAAMLLTFSFPAEAQQTQKVARIGYVSGSAKASLAQVQGFREGLRKLDTLREKTSS